MNPRNQSFVVTFLLIVAAVAMIVMAFQRESGSSQSLTINELARDIKSGKVAALRIAEIDVPVRKLDRDIAPELICEAGVQRPGKIPLAERAAEGIAAAIARA